MGKVKKSRCGKSGDYNSSTRLIDSPYSDPDLDAQEDDSWVIVKKQRVIILVPSLPVADISVPRLKPGPKQSDVERVGRVIEFPRHYDREKPVLVAPKKSLQVAQTKQSRQDMNWARATKSHKPLGVAKASRMIVRPTLPVLALSGSREGGTQLNLSLRALNLERKLQRAGGLSRWLASLGLEQFARLFQRKGLGKFHLVNLTMKKLKDMGANAVGPRRKLIHAIDCICQPYCFQAF